MKKEVVEKKYRPEKAQDCIHLKMEDAMFCSKCRWLINGNKTNSEHMMDFFSESATGLLGLSCNNGCNLS